MSWLDTPIFGTFTAEILIVFLLVVLIGALIGRISNYLIRRTLDERVGRRMSKLIARLVMYSILIAAISIAFSQVLKQELTGLIISLGFVGVALAFASQQIISNILSGIIISFTRPIQLEDWVEVGQAPTTGVCRVKDINLLNTVLRDVEGRIIMIPNSLILNGKVVNYTQAGFVATQINLWVDPNSDMDLIRSIIYDEADRDERIIPGIESREQRGIMLKLFRSPGFRNLLDHNEDLSKLDPQVNILDLHGSKMRLNIRIWIREINNRDDIVSKYISAVKDRFKEAGIELMDP
jgi:small-conductance mechanosensitive channel